MPGLMDHSGIFETIFYLVCRVIIKIISRFEISIPTNQIVISDSICHHFVSILPKMTTNLVNIEINGGHNCDTSVIWLVRI